MEAVERTLFVLDLTGRCGVMTVARLAQQPGWNKPAASRDLTAICDLGWLERVSDKGFPRYVLGRKTMALAPDVQL